MTKAEFVKNNRGINDNADLPEEYLSDIFDDIVNNEIRMKDEVESPIPSASSAPGLANAIVNVGRDLQREAYVVQTSGMATKTEVGIYDRWIFGSDRCPGSLSHLDAVST
jgi:brefeldin A-inhibited guanine nucleotide-exchange protein